MSEVGFNVLLVSGVGAVLETMFFTAPSAPNDSDPGSTVHAARVVFDGEPSGTLGVRISESSARSLAAAFLGEDEELLSPIQVGQVVCELANMLCGWVLSQVEPDRHFDLGAPELLYGESGDLHNSPSTSEESFAIGSGILTVSLHLNPRHEI